MKKTLKSIITGALTAAMLLTSTFAASAAICPSEPVVANKDSESTAEIYFYTRSKYTGETRFKSKITAHVGDVIEVSISPKTPDKDYIYSENSQFATFFNLSDLNKDDVLNQNNHMLQYYAHYYKPTRSGKYMVYDTEKIAPTYCINLYEEGKYTNYSFEKGDVNGLCFNHTQIIDKPTIDEMGDYLRFTVKVVKPGVCNVLTKVWSAAFSNVSMPTSDVVHADDVNVSGKVVGKADPKYLLGDVNLDGSISIKDVTKIQRYLAKSATLDADALYRANVKRSGTCNIVDATLIQKYVAKQIVSFI